MLETSTSPAPCFLRDARPDVNGDTVHLAVDELALTGVQAGPNVDAEFPNGFGDCRGAADRACRAVERGEEAVSGGVELLAPEGNELVTDQRMVALDMSAVYYASATRAEARL